ncbi:MAG: response regulator transcription factor [Gammaproteobacteria bacterium]
MNLLLVDDHALFREGLRALLLNISPELTIYEAASVEGAVDECRSTEFRMVLLDLHLSRSDGLDTLDSFRGRVPNVSGGRTVRRPGAATHSRGNRSRRRRLRAEVAHVGSDDRRASSRALRRGVSSAACARGPGRHPTSNGCNRRTAFARLSPRQHQVAQLLLQGQPNKVIARQLGLSEGTIKAHVSAIYQIIGAKNRVEAVTLAARSGIAVM